MRAIVFLALISVASALAKNEESRIIGGALTTIEEFPFLASLQILHDDVYLEHICGGTLLTSVTVLTAGWCFVYDPSILVWRVRLGSTRASGSGSLHSMSRATIHPEIIYSTRANDIATIRLSTPAVFSNTVQAARIAGINYNLADGTEVSAVGWGVNNRAHSDILRKKVLNIVNQEECVEKYVNNSTAEWEVTDSSICATGAICVGDYGGPIVHQGDVVVGVMSFGYMCNSFEFPSVSTRVSLFSDWIVANA